MSKDHYEIEVKILEIDKKELERKLKEIGAKKLFSDRKVIQENYDNKELKKKAQQLELDKWEKMFL